MALPTISARPEKSVNGVLSRWNAANLPLQYTIANTKWPTNSEDTIDTIDSIADDGNGYAKLVLNSSSGYTAKQWIEVTGTTNYNAVSQIRLVDGVNITIEQPFGVSETGSAQLYFQNYTILATVRAGIDPTHAHAATKPIEVIGTIEQKPNSDNNTPVDVRKYIKNKLNTDYNESQASWPNDLNAWTDFYISFAERYDIVTAGEVVNFTSAFTDDKENGDIIYLKAAMSSLPFGYAFSGNMGEYVIDIDIYFNTAKWLTDFERAKVIDNNNFNVSIISMVTPFDIEIKQYDVNGALLVTATETISNQGYGLYRLWHTQAYHADVSFATIQAQIHGGTNTSELFTFDVDNACI